MCPDFHEPTVAYAQYDVYDSVIYTVSDEPKTAHHRDTNRISTRFFFGVKNMSRCVKYQKLGQGVGVSFCNSCHSVKMRQKHLDLLESSRGPPQGQYVLGPPLNHDARCRWYW